MTYMPNQTMGAPTKSAGFVPFQIILRGFAAVAAAFENRRELKQLAMMNDAMLRDMGLTRYDVEQALSASMISDPASMLSQSRRSPHRLDRDF